MLQKKSWCSVASFFFRLIYCSGFIWIYIIRSLIPPSDTRDQWNDVLGIDLMKETKDMWK